jgi:tetratricopeptide (TPR) repeat protein
MTEQPQKKNRRAMLEAFVASHPNDAFGLYGLAIECANQDDAPAAQQHFEKLLATNPDYITGYFQYGQFLARLARNDEARRMLTSGIEAAYRTGDSHAAEEMQSALSLLPS